MQKPRICLKGTDGSMFHVIRECIAVAKSFGWTEQELEVWCTNAVDGDYEHLMRCVEEKFDVEA